MTKLFLFLAFTLVSLSSIASGCFADSPFYTNGSCDPNTPSTLEVCFTAGGGLDLPDDTDVFWDFGDGSTSNQFDPCHTYPAAGTYTVYRRIDVSCGTFDLLCKLHLGFGSSISCDYTGEITIYDQSFASSLVTSLQCPDNIGTATFSPSTTDGVSWLWDAADDDIYYNIGDNALDGSYKPITNSSTDLVFQSSTSGDHTLYYTYGSGCAGVETFNFDLVELEDIQVTSDYNGFNVSCFEASDGQITAEASGGTAPLTYTWDSGFTETNTTGISINDNIEAGTHNLDITDADGCLVSVTIDVTEPDELLATVVVTPTLCGVAPITGDIEITSITGGTPAYTTLWSNGSNQLLLDDVTSNTYNLSIKDLNNCEYTESVVLYNSSEPVANFSVGNECLYDDAVYLDMSTTLVGNITNWDWEFDDGATSTDQNPIHTYSTSGDYTPTLTITNSDNCTHTITRNLTMHPAPSALFSVNNQCQETELCFTDLSTVGNPDAITSYIYNFGDVSPFNNTAEPCHLYNAPGDYNVTLIVSTNNGCINDVTIPLTVYPEPEINLSATTICVNQPPTVFTNLSTVLNPDDFQSWNWDFGDGYSASLETPTHNYSASGDYTVSLTGVTNNNCIETAEITVTVYEKPTASLTSNIVDSCSIACINFESTSTSATSAIIEWEWDFNNGRTSTDEKPSSCFANLSNTDELTFDINLIALNDLGCYDTLNSENYITVWHNPIADFDANSYVIDMYAPDFEFYNISTGEDTYDWNFGDSTTSILENPFHTYSDTGTYEVMLIASTIHNCTDTIWKPVRVEAVTSIYAPNTFTPDGDEVNDIFRVVGYNLAEIELFIYDRWGVLLYTGIGLDAGWDGTYKNEMSQQDSYIWTVEAFDTFGKRQQFTGHVNLLR